MAHESWGAPGVSKENLAKIVGVPGIPLNVHKDVAYIHQWLADRLKLCRKEGAPPLNSSGGYVKRYIKGTTTWSNHSWGLAVDYNAATNPYAYGGTTDFKPDEVRKLLKQLKHMRWGYDYTGKKDAMHFEWIGSRQKAAEVTEELKKSGSVTSGAKVLEAQMRLAALGLTSKAPDGKHDDATTAAVKAFQALAFPGQQAEHDGHLGPKTLSKLEFWNLNLKMVGPAMEYRGFLPEGASIKPGDTVISPNKKTFLTLQTDGNLVLYKEGKALWSSQTRGNVATLQKDGNFVLYLTNGSQAVAVWHSKTAGKAEDCRLAVQDDGNLVLYGMVYVWHTSTNA